MDGCAITSNTLVPEVELYPAIVQLWTAFSQVSSAVLLSASSAAKTQMSASIGEDFAYEFGVSRLDRLHNSER